MTSSSLGSIVCAVVVATATGVMQPAHADDADNSSWSTTVWGGWNWPENGDLFHGSRAAIDDGSGTYTGFPLSYRDAFRAGPALGLEASRSVTSHWQPFVRFAYSQARGSNVNIGEASLNELASPALLRADFSNLESASLDFGGRYTFDESVALHPFLAGYAGVARARALRARLISAELPVSTDSQTILPAETRFNAGIEGGLDYAFGNNTDLLLKLGADYEHAADARSTALESLGVPMENLHAMRWTFPLELGFAYYF